MAIQVGLPDVGTWGLPWPGNHLLRAHRSGVEMCRPRFELLAEGVEMKSGMGVRMTVPTLRRDGPLSVDGSAVGRYTPWVSPLTCIAKGANNSRWTETRGREHAAILREFGRPYYKVTSIIKVLTGRALLAFPRKIQPASPASPCTDTPRYSGAGPP